LMTSGRSQMLATRNFRDWHAIFGEVTSSADELFVKSLSQPLVRPIGVARILSGGALFAKKVDALKHCLNLPQNLSHVAKTVLKIDSCSGWGVHFVLGGALTFFQ